MSSEMLALAEILASHYKEVEAKDKRIAELEGLAQMIIDAESADTSLIPIMFYTWLHKAKALKEQGDD